MPLTKQYLRYVPGHSFGLVTSRKGEALIYQGPNAKSRRLAVCPALEGVALWDMRTSTKVCSASWLVRYRSMDLSSGGRAGGGGRGWSGRGLLESWWDAAGCWSRRRKHPRLEYGWPHPLCYLQVSLDILFILIHLVYITYSPITSPLPQHTHTHTHIHTHTHTHTHSGHKSAVSCMKFDSSGTRLVSGSKDTNLIVWDIVSQTGLFRWGEHGTKSRQFYPKFHYFPPAGWGATKVQ